MMNKTTTKTLLCMGNTALRQKNYSKAVEYYSKAIVERPELSHTINASLQFAHLKLQQSCHTVETDKKPPRYMLFISHDASLTGAPAVLIEVISWLKNNSNITPRIIIGGTHTDRLEAFTNLGDCLHIPDINSFPDEILQEFLTPNIDIILSNTVASGRILQKVKNILGSEKEYIAYIHEKKGVLDHFATETLYIINHCKKIIAVSDDITHELKARGAPRRTIIDSIPPFIRADPNNYEDAKNTTTNPVIYGCGTIEHRKGFDIFCETLQILRKRTKVKFQATWIGKSANIQEPYDSLKKFDVLNFVSTPGPHKNPRSLYRQGDIFFMSSREDPFPLVCIEAAERGLPIVCFDERAGSMASFVRKSQGGLTCNYLDVEDAAFCLQQILENPEMGKAMGDNAKHYATSKHVTSSVMPTIMDFILPSSLVQNNLVSRKKTILVVSFGPIPIKNIQAVEGGGLRAWGLANGLASSTNEFEIQLTFPKWYLKDSNQINLNEVPSNIQINTWGTEEELISQAAQANVVIVSYCYGSYSKRIKDALNCHQTLVLDCYVPIHSEVSARRSSDKISELDSFKADSVTWEEMLKSGDLLLCASEEQKNYYLGLLFGIGKITPINYEQADNIIIAPFGIEGHPPHKPTLNPITQTIKSDNEIKLLWFGGVYPWFDIKTLIRAVKHIRQNLPCNLTIVGARNPFNSHPDFVRISKEIEEIAQSPEYNDFIYLQDWVPYNERLNWYHDADLIISLNQPGIENRFSWRTRILDYLWAERPFATNGGDPISELLIDIGLGHQINTESEESLATSLSCVIKAQRELSNQDSSINKERLAEVKEKLSWQSIGGSILASITKASSKK